ncbi:MAG: hypothetical protein ACRD2N_24015 [Vicinamibacterales bacterium]
MTAAMLTAALAMTAGSDQAGLAFTGLLHEHPRIQYATRPTSDRVSRLNRALVEGSTSLARDSQTGYLRPVLDALGLSPESQLLVFSKTGVQRSYTSPQNPRAIYFDDGVVVAYVPGAPALEIATEDREQGVVFYTLDQTAVSSPTFTRRTTCLTCHVSASTLDVPGIIVRSNAVGDDGNLVPEMASQTVNHLTPHTQRWGGWFVTNRAVDPPYQALGHMGNITFTVHPISGPSIVSNKVMVEWLNSEPERRGYLSSASDIGGLLAFDHQSHAMNLLTRLNWQSRIAAGTGPLDLTTGRLRGEVNDLADYLLFVGEFPPMAPITPRPGFAERLTSSARRSVRAILGTARSHETTASNSQLLRLQCPCYAACRPVRRAETVGPDLMMRSDPKRIPQRTPTGTASAATARVLKAGAVNGPFEFTQRLLTSLRRF